ncbi:MAG: hypothetical protein ACOCQD_02140 [archaeon]
MDSNNKIAKNLLEGRTCDNCRYKECEQGDVCYCVLYKQLDSNPYLGVRPIPKENTCTKWEKRINKKLNVRWTKESEIDLTKDIEKNLIKTVSKELIKFTDNEVNKSFEANSQKPIKQ